MRGDPEEDRWNGRRPEDLFPPHDINAERAILASMILSGDAAAHALDEIGARDFYSPQHATIFTVFEKLSAFGKPLDTVTIKDELQKQGKLDDVGGIQFLISLLDDAPTGANIASYITIVKERAMRRRILEACMEAVRFSYDDTVPTKDLLSRVQNAVLSMEAGNKKQGALPLSKIVMETMEYVNKIHDGELNALSGIPTNFKDLDAIIGGLGDGELIVIAGRPGMGKAQPLDANILTLCGWKRMENVSVGDKLASIDGLPSEVVGVYPQGEKQVYRVTFSDGRNAECCEDHLWQITYRDWDKPRVVTCQRLTEMLKYKRYRNRIWIDNFDGNFGKHQKLPLDPWVLGYMIGNGSFMKSTPSVSTRDAEIPKRICDTFMVERRVSKVSKYDYRIVKRTRGFGNPLTSALKTLGLWGLHSQDRFIPRLYMSADKNSRIGLLRGLIDSDGYAHPWGTVEFDSSSERLSKDVVDLVRSLGGWGWYKKKSTSFVYKGKKKAGLPDYRCHLHCADPSISASLSRKICRLKTQLNVISVAPTRVAKTQCIRVSHPSGLYVTDNFVVTHNTTLALNLAGHISVHQKIPTLFFSLETGYQALSMALLGMLGRANTTAIRMGYLTAKSLGRLNTRAAPELYEAPMVIDDTPSLNIVDICTRTRRYIKQYGCRVVFIDYLQHIRPYQRERSREQEVSEITKMLKDLARDMSVPVVALAQLNRNLANREDRRPALQDLRESGQIEAEADVVLMLHRPDYYDKDARPGIVEVWTEKHRDGPTGVIELTYIKEQSRIEDLIQPGANEEYSV